MLDKVNKETGAFLIKGGLPVQENQQIGHQQEPVQTDRSQLETSRRQDPALSAARPGQEGESEQKQPEKAQPVRVEKKVGRNEPCPCGSGKKFKQCHGKPQPVVN